MFGRGNAAGALGNLNLKITHSAIILSARGLRVGDLVEVRSADEIIATLDERGELENLPFMPEMLKFCGQRLTVDKVAHKLCDTMYGSGLHKMENAVHLTNSRSARRTAAARPHATSTGRKLGSSG